MNDLQIESLLQSIENAKRDNRDRVANIVFENEYLLPDLVEMVFKTEDKLSIRAGWILEWICTHKDLNIIIPYLDTFVNQLHKLHFDSVIRPCAKICEHLASAYTSKKENIIKDALTQEQINTIIETGFDWLITPQKIAVRAYTMNTLFLFGLDKDWVHPELDHLIRTKIIQESKGCKARGKHILEAIEKHQKRSS